MLCPYCLHDESKVVDKRDYEGIVKRRRECTKCVRRFNTNENAERIELKVVKKDGGRQEFDLEKIRKGVMRACEKRPVSAEKIDKMLRKIEERLRKKGKEVKAEFIGETVSKELKKSDNIAYIRFASVYKEFTEVNDFKKAIKELVGK